MLINPPIPQVYKILQYVESYQKEHELNPMPIILCGSVLVGQIVSLIF